MSASNPLRILVEHDFWATRNILSACQGLTDSQMHQEFEMGVGTLHNTLVHILGAMHAWSDLLAQREQRPRLEYTKRTMDELLGLFEEIGTEFSKLALEHPVDELVSGERGGRSYTFCPGRCCHSCDNSRYAPSSPVSEYASAPWRFPAAGQLRGRMGHAGRSNRRLMRLGFQD